MGARQVVSGALGDGCEVAANALTASAGGATEVVRRPRLRVHASGPTDAIAATPGAAEVRLAWSAAPLPADWSSQPTVELVRRDLSVVEERPDGTVALHGGISGARPVYVALDDGIARFATSVTALAASPPGRRAADWDAWASILALGGPVGGRTPFVGIDRLGPQASVEVPIDGDPVHRTARWDWLELAVGSGDVVDSLPAVREALRSSVQDLAAGGELAPLLSGGWDSRILAVLATAVQSSPPTVWTTSSDIGTTLEELVAAEVAAHLGVPHRLVAPRFDAFVEDARWYAGAVEHQSSFHVWMASLARALDGSDATVLDGLGGGVFLGGAFVEPDGGGDAVARRFARMARYLDHAEQVVRPEVAEQLRERAWTAFEAVARPLAGHPDARAFTAYLTRTVPGIALGPYGAIGAVARVATPFLADDVVRAALRIPPAARCDGALYRPLLASLAPDLAALPTAAERSGRPRHRTRRVSSPVAARWYRTLLTTGPVGDLLAPVLREAPVEVWQQYLGRTRSQHLIRSLATLALWLDEHGPRLEGPGVDTLAEPAG